MVEKKIYYKATRTNGTDFRTGKVLYEVGKESTPLPDRAMKRICGPGYLHASDVPGETLIGGRWPCRLFEVTGTPEVGFAGSEYTHKGGFTKLRVVREIAAELAFGPHGGEVVRIINHIPNLDVATWREWALKVGIKATDVNSARMRASAVAPKAGVKAGLAAAKAAIQEAAGTKGLNHTQQAYLQDAALAHMVRDQLSVQDFELLTDTWYNAVGDLSRPRLLRWSLAA